MQRLWRHAHLGTLMEQGACILGVLESTRSDDSRWHELASVSANPGRGVTSLQLTLDAANSIAWKRSKEMPEFLESSSFSSA